MQSWFSRVSPSLANKKKSGADGGGRNSPHSPLAGAGFRGISGRGREGASCSALAAVPVSAEELARGQVVTRTCEELVREIQRILRSAKEAALRQQQQQQDDEGDQPSRWPGTEELLGLLSSSASSSTSSAGAVLGDLEALMDHPQFVSRCLDAALPPNLGHCLRLMRVIELENAAPSESGGAAGDEEVETATPLTRDATARIAKILVKASHASSCNGGCTDVKVSLYHVSFL